MASRYLGEKTMIKFIAPLLLIVATPAFADAPYIKNVNAHKHGDTWTFDVTLEHDDSGWDHYADGWRVLDPSGKELGLRKLVHPHVNEQPFTRSLSGVRIPTGVTEVGIQASDTVDGWSSSIKTVKLR
jgi:hypothetical protein